MGTPRSALAVTGDGCYRICHRRNQKKKAATTTTTTTATTASSVQWQRQCDKDAAATTTATGSIVRLTRTAEMPDVSHRLAWAAWMMTGSVQRNCSKPCGRQLISGIHEVLGPFFREPESPEPDGGLRAGSFRKQLVKPPVAGTKQRCPGPSSGAAWDRLLPFFVLQKILTILVLNIIIMIIIITVVMQHSDNINE